MGRDTECDQRVASIPVTQSGPHASVARATTLMTECLVHPVVAHRTNIKEAGKRFRGRSLVAESGLLLAHFVFENTVIHWFIEDGRADRAVSGLSKRSVHGFSLPFKELR
jgi:hypothetical protein